MRNLLKLFIFCIFFASVLSLNVVGDNVGYVGSFFEVSKLCDGSIKINVVVDNNGGFEEDVYAHVYSKSLGMDAFSPVIHVSEGSLGNIMFTENVEKNEFLSGFYGVGVEVYNNGEIRSYPEKFFFDGCINGKKSEVIKQGGIVEDEISENEPEKANVSFSLILSLILAVFVVILAFVFIISSYIVL